jgi:hypothetical protein
MGGMTARFVSSNDFILIGEKRYRKRFMASPFLLKCFAASLLMARRIYTPLLIFTL